MDFKKVFLIMLVLLSNTCLVGYMSHARQLARQSSKLQSTRLTSSVSPAKAREVENIVRYTQQPVNIYWGASFGAPFYDSYYARAPYYGGYNYPYTYGIFFGW